MVEFRKFLCDDTAYVEEKKVLLAENPVGKAILVSTISAAIGATIGFTATLLAPAVTVLLCTVGKMGIRAYCEKG
jgi:energy-coupling factor transporter transmembrane protein EcfT